MANLVRLFVVIALVLELTSGVFGIMEQVERDPLEIQLPYGRGLVNQLQLARLLMFPQRICHPKRNSELINSLLGLPKNMNNVGK
ncbi:pigment-dispersing hormone peptides [Prorops nasuta]|uniref:pigment-dispersing hormone peptides n=1 Tax=Prorops nasuta TaxID=863751 RepID=UPI0034CF906D